MTTTATAAHPAGQAASRADLQSTLQAAIQAGLLPAAATLPEPHARPWPLVLLTALGAWLAVLPLMGVVVGLMGDVLRAGAAPYGVGALLLVGAVVVMRSNNLAVFLEQLALPALLVGAGTLGLGVYRDLHAQAGSTLMLVVALVLAAAIPKAWLRTLLGAASAGLLCVALMPRHWDGMHQQTTAPWLVLQAALALWLAALWGQQRHLLAGARARWAALLEAFLAGWLLTVLLGLAALSGATFLMGGTLGEVGALAHELNRPGRVVAFNPLLQVGSVLGALLGAGFAARAWPGLRHFLPLAAAVVLAGLGWFLPTLGAVVLALAVCGVTHRLRLASASALAAAWVLGSFYYQLQWPLASKAQVLVAAACLLGSLAWWASRATRTTTTTTTPAAAHAAPARTSSPTRDDPALGLVHPATPWPLGRVGWSVLAAALLTLLVVNGAIWQKQSLIAQGKPVFVALAPADPRSLMQGDYMRLNFALAGVGDQALLQGMAGQRPRVVALMDGRGVAQVLHLFDAHQPLAAGELLIELSPKGGRWILVSDAWFFKEGQADRWQAAKFGEFRVLPDGRALLVGLADAELRSIQP